MFVFVVKKGGIANLHDRSSRAIFRDQCTKGDRSKINSIPLTALTNSQPIWYRLHREHANRPINISVKQLTLLLGIFWVWSVQYTAPFEIVQFNTLAVPCPICTGRMLNFRWLHFDCMLIVKLGKFRYAWKYLNRIPYPERTGWILIEDRICRLRPRKSETFPLFY